MTRRLVTIATGCALFLSFGCQKEQSAISPAASNSQELAQPKERESSTPYIEVQYHSAADRYQMRAMVLPPLSGRPPEAAVLLLGDYEVYKDYLRSKDNIAKVWIPSRPGLNYQLLAEGDLWGCWEQCVAQFPALKSLPLYLAGQGVAAEAATQLANNYRARIKGIAIGAEPRQLNVPNLDYLPVVAYEQSGQRFIARLTQRGNAQATTIKGSLADAVKLLMRSPMQADHLAPYSFDDNRYGKPWPWLKVIARQSEDQPVTISAQIDGEQLELQGQNFTAVAVDRSPESGFPEAVSSLRFGGKLYALQDEGTGTVILGEPSGQLRWRRKADNASGFRSFYDGSPTIVVYQDDGAQRDYLELARELAQKLSSLHLQGLPTLDVDLPLLPLSRYKPSRHAPHRLIVIGKHRVLRTLVERSPGYLPLPGQGQQSRAYSLIYPPEDQTDISLACLISADNVAGLQALSEHFSKATVLGERSDLIVWSERDSGYIRKSTRTFNSYWGESSPHLHAMTIPRQSPETWDQFLEELLMQETDSRYMILPSLVSYRYSMPTELSSHNLTQWIPERHFALVTAYGVPSAGALRALMQASRATHLSGMEPFLDPAAKHPEIAADSLRRQTLKILVDYAVLQQLSEQERSLIGYELLPYSLHEIIQQRLESDQRAFVRDLLRQGTPVSPR